MRKQADIGCCTVEERFAAARLSGITEIRDFKDFKDLKVIRVIKDKKSPFTELRQQASAINLLYCRAAKAEEPKAQWEI